MALLLWFSGFYTVKFFDGVIKTVKGIKVKPFRKVQEQIASALIISKPDH